ncbi:MAG: DPP IV N-terminal domain-containing protein [Planctomycetota bacterium]|nr:DPP IV N-terminal domain-containing protein [Planctomycetota bacterium]
MRTLRIGKSFSACALLAFSFVLLPGCSKSLKVTIVTDPGDAVGTITEIKVGGETGRTYVFSENAGDLNLTHTDNTIAFRFEAKRTDFQPLLRELTLTEINSMRLNVRDAHEVKLTLTNEYVVQQQLIVVYDADLRSFVGKARTVRAWRNTTGDDRGVVSRVFDRIEPNAGIRGMTMSPDGHQLVFSEAIPKEWYPDAIAPQANNVIKLESCNLKSIKIDFSDTRGDPRAGGIEHIRQGDYRDLDPAFTSDGANLIFSSNRRRAHASDLLQISVDQSFMGGIRDIYRVPDKGIALSPSTGYNGLIAFCIEDPERGSEQIWTVGGGRFPTELINGRQPKISPDGTKIAFIGEDDNLWVISSEGHSPTQLTYQSDEILDAYREQLTEEELITFDPALFAPYSFPTWTPDGTQIVYTSMENVDTTNRPNDDIWIINEDGTGRESITSNGSIDSNPVVSPDGRFVFFVSNRGGDWSIWAMAMNLNR